MNLKKIKHFFTVLQRTGSKIFSEQSYSEIDKYKLLRDLFVEGPPFSSEMRHRHLGIQGLHAS
jgi:hypothetical protein